MNYIKLNRMLLFVWITSLPFGHFSLVGRLSIDNILSPVVFVLTVAALLAGGLSLSRAQRKYLLIVASISVSYVLSHMLPLVNSSQAIWITTIYSAKSMLYFLIPVMCIRSIYDLRAANNAIIVVCFIASISALAVTLGLLDFEFTRDADSRIGEGYLKKTIGVVSSYGDVGLLYSISLLLAATSWKAGYFFFGKGSLWKTFLVFATIIVGIGAMQSRNILFTLLVSSMFYWITGKLAKTPRLLSKKLFSIIFFAAATAAIMISMFSAEMIDWVSSLGGTREAAGTVSDRLIQYQEYLALLDGNWIFGASAEIMDKNYFSIFLIHNMWLKELMQGGIPAILCTLFFIFNAINTQSKNFSAGHMKKEAKVYISVIAGAIVATQFYPGGTPLFWAVLGLCSSMPISPNVISATKKP